MICGEIMGNRLGTADSCLILKSNGVAGGRPIKRFPQTNLIHKKKVKRMELPMKCNRISYTINTVTKILITAELKALLDQLLSRNPRCKVFRDLYQNLPVCSNNIVFKYLFTLDSEFPVLSIANSKFIDVVIISNKEVLAFIEDFTCIENDAKIIFNRMQQPKAAEKKKIKHLSIPEYNFIQFPVVSQSHRLLRSRKFKPVLTPKRIIN